MSAASLQTDKAQSRNSHDAAPILIVELTIRGAIVLGRICFLMILKLREPVAFAASIYSLVFIAITVARIILADIAMPPIDSANAVFIGPDPKRRIWQ